MELEIGDIVLCTVDKIVGTIVFVQIEGEKKEGSIILSEIAPGRIRNLRDYVVPKKKIICKILRISDDRIDLSLRRVTPKDQKELKEKFKQEKSYQSIFKSVLGNKAEEIIKKIKEKEDLYSFIEEAKQNTANMEKTLGKENSKKILELITMQKRKKAQIKKEIKLTTIQPNGLELIKKLNVYLINVEAKQDNAVLHSIQILE